MSGVPLRVIDACPCYLAQNLNNLSEILAVLKARAHTVAPDEIPKLLRPLEKALDQCRADYKEHVGTWRERYALVLTEQMKRNSLEALQTSAWKEGDLKKLLEEKPKKAHKRAAAAPIDAGIALASVKREKQQQDSLED
jgi:hypothetical protein